MRTTDHAWALGLAVGPLFAWLCWALQRKRWGHAAAAAVANLALWVAGPAFILSMI